MKEMTTERAISVRLVLLVSCLFTNSLIHESWPSSRAQSETLTQLHSAEWMQRQQAYKEIIATPAALKDPEVKRALVDLLELENHVIESTLRESHGQAAVDEKYGEGYSEYYTMLLGTVDTIADWNDPVQFCVLAHASYNPDSPFAAKLASHGKYGVQCLIQMYGSDVGLTRAQAAAVLVALLAKAKTGIDLSVIQQVRQLVIRALRDPSEAVRSNTVEALGNFGGTDMIPALRRVARTDPSPPVHGSSIRKSAAKAITQIERRAGQRKLKGSSAPTGR